jgi:hypothetical protein
LGCCPGRDLTLAAIGLDGAPVRRSLSQSALDPRPISTHRSRLTFLAVNAAEPLRRIYLLRQRRVSLRLLRASALSQSADRIALRRMGMASAMERHFGAGIVDDELQVGLRPQFLFLNNGRSYEHAQRFI